MPRNIYRATENSKKRKTFRKIQYRQPCFPYSYQVLADVAGNNINDDVTIDKDTMIEQELDRLNKKLMARLIIGKLLT